MKRLYCYFDIKPDQLMIAKASYNILYIAYDLIL